MGRRLVRWPGSTATLTAEKNPDSPAAFLDSCRGYPTALATIRARCLTPWGASLVANGSQAKSYLLEGLTPSVDGKPKVSRRWANEAFPTSCKPSSISSGASRTWPTVFMPAASKAVRILGGRSTCSSGVSSGSSGVGSSMFGSLIFLRSEYR
jgi:hypothetical protein